MLVILIIKITKNLIVCLTILTLLLPYVTTYGNYNLDPGEGGAILRVSTQIKMHSMDLREGTETSKEDIYFKVYYKSWYQFESEVAWNFIDPDPGYWQPLTHEVWNVPPDNPTDYYIVSFDYLRIDTSKSIYIYVMEKDDGSNDEILFEGHLYLKPQTQTGYYTITGAYTYGHWTYFNGAYHTQIYHTENSFFKYSYYSLYYGYPKSTWQSNSLKIDVTLHYHY